MEWVTSTASLSGALSWIPVSSTVRGMLKDDATISRLLF